MTMIQRDIRYAVRGYKNASKSGSGDVVGDVSRYLISEIPFNNSVFNPTVVCYNKKNSDLSYDKSNITKNKNSTLNSNLVFSMN